MGVQVVPGLPEAIRRLVELGLKTKEELALNCSRLRLLPMVVFSHFSGGRGFYQWQTALVLTSSLRSPW